MTETAPEEELHEVVRNWLKSKGGMVSGSAIGQRFGVVYNTWIREGSGRDDGKFRKWVAKIPGIEVQTGATIKTWTVRLTDIEQCGGRSASASSVEHRVPEGSLTGVVGCREMALDLVSGSIFGAT